MPAPVVAVLHHLERPITGHAGRVLRAAGVHLDERRRRAGDPLPALEEVDGLLSLGGEQSVRDLDRHADLAEESAFLREAVAREVPVLGVCLGGQLLAHALGGTVARLPRPLLEWAPIEPLPAAAGDPVLGALPPGGRALHWNEDGFTVPPGAVELLRPVSAGAEGFRAGRAAWGIQFHPEVDGEILDRWYVEWPEEAPGAGRTLEEARAADARWLDGQARVAEALFGGFARVVAAARAPSRRGA